MRIWAVLVSVALAIGSVVMPSSAIASTPELPAAPLFNQVQMKVLVDNDFAVFMGNDQQVTRLFYQNNSQWGNQVQNIQTLDVFPAAGETFVYLVPMGGNTYIAPGGGEGGQENFSGVLNNIPLLDYPGAQVAIGRSVSDVDDILHSGYLLLNNHLTNYTTSISQVENGSFSVLLEDLSVASTNLLWGPAERDDYGQIPAPITGCTVACDGARFSPAIPDGAWDFPDGSAVLFRYPLSNANLPVSPGDRSVTISWQDPGAGGPVSEYLIEYKETDQDDSAFKVFGTVAGTSRSSTVTGLTNGTAYTLRVSAVNESGSASSLGRSVVPTGTPSRPANQSYAAGDGEVTINFSAPVNDGGMAVTNYAYSIDDGATWITRNPPSTLSPITISGLTNFTNYSIRLRAINPFGAGQASLPIEVQAGIVSTRTLTYDAGTLAPVTNLASGAVLEEEDAFTVAEGPTRTNFTFTGWKDGAVEYAAGDTYTVGASNPNLTAQWVQNSLLGVPSDNKSRVLTWNIVEDESIDVTVSAGAGNSVRIQIPANALEPGTEVIFWRLLNDDVAKQRINSEKDYFVNLAITWSLGDDINTPMVVVDATSPIVMTINNPSIVQGATAWQIVGEEAEVVGTASQAGQLTLSFTEDPVITAANVPPAPEFSTPVATEDGFAVNITNFDASYTWESPTVSDGSVSITGTSGSTRSLVVSGLGSAASATITQRVSLNGVFQSATVTGASIDPTPPPTPEFSSPVATEGGFTVDITNFDASSTWESPTVSAGSVSITGTSGSTRSLVVSGLGSGESATITQEVSLNGNLRSASVTGTALDITEPDPPPTVSRGISVPQVPSLDPGQEIAISESEEETIFLTGDFLNLITEVKLGGLLDLPFEASANGEQISITIPATRSGEINLTLRYGALSLEQTITVSRAVDPGVVNAGTFKGFVAIYAKGFEGRRLSAKVGEDWVIVNSLNARFVRITERVRWTDYGLSVRIFIDRRLVRTVNLSTR
jgi:hypothetical protein